MILNSILNEELSEHSSILRSPYIIGMLLSFVYRHNNFRIIFGLVYSYFWKVNVGIPVSNRNLTLFQTRWKRGKGKYGFCLMYILYVSNYLKIKRVYQGSKFRIFKYLEGIEIVSFDCITYYICFYLHNI